MNKMFSRSQGMSREYCCTIVRVGDIEPIQGSDFLGKTLVDGVQIVVRKDEVSKGDIMFYASNETELCEGFLSVNNLFSREFYDKNANSASVGEMVAKRDALKAKLESGSSASDAVELAKVEDAIKSCCGFFGRYGRVRMINLRKCPSFGFLFTPESLYKYRPELKSVNLAEWVDDPEADHDFDTVCGELFVKAYIPRPSNPRKGSSGRESRRQKKVRKTLIIPNEFFFHYDTSMLVKNMHRFNPDTEVDISTKMHGTSLILGNLKVKAPLGTDTGVGFWDKFTGAVGRMLYRTFGIHKVVYRYVCSSRTVIRDVDLTGRKTNSFYKADIWSEYEKHLEGWIPEGMTIYGEIVGYLTGSSVMIQKDYDYGCKEGTNRLMIYRITTSDKDGKQEWEIEDVITFSEALRAMLPDIILPFPLLYHGTLKDLYPDIPVDDNWRDAVLERLKTEDRFGMERNEPMCSKKVPREGIVMRICHDPLKEAFKLKCAKFLQKEAESIDKGLVDMEMQDKYVEGSETVES